MIGYGICAAIMLFYNIESKMSDITVDLANRKANNK